jgi:hypothetical protein
VALRNLEDLYVLHERKPVLARISSRVFSCLVFAAAEHAVKAPCQGGCVTLCGTCGSCGWDHPACIHSASTSASTESRRFDPTGLLSRPNHHGGSRFIRVRAACGIIGRHSTGKRVRLQPSSLQKALPSNEVGIMAGQDVRGSCGPGHTGAKSPSVIESCGMPAISENAVFTDHPRRSGRAACP